MNLELVREAAGILRSGGVVVLPTETVYGLACNALDKAAVGRVFRIKERPFDNPLIVHIADISQLDGLVTEIPASVKMLAERFWPGPLTVVLKKRPTVPSETTAGLDTVAVRMPNHEIALAVIKESGLLLAAPSANRFTELSPTRVKDLDPQIVNQTDLVLDGGPCQIGVESTVLDITQDPPRILRPGAISTLDLTECGIEPGNPQMGGERRSPGQYPRHYAPNTKVVLVDELPEGAAGLSLSAVRSQDQILMPNNVGEYQRMLYHALYELDRSHLTVIYVERPPNIPEWAAVNDRLLKASSPEG